MSLGYNTLRAFPRLRTYEDAAAYEAKVKPIRGRDPEVKPLGRRSQAYYSIKREGDDICICAGAELLIRFRPSGDMLIYDSGYWSKATYNDIIGEVTGLITTTQDSKMWARVDGGMSLIRPSPRRKWNGTKWIEPTDTTVPENIFRLTEKYADNPGYRVWTYVNPPGIVVHHIRRKEMREVRERYAAFIDYAKAMDSIRKDNKPEPQEYAEPFGVKFATSNDGSRTYYVWHKAGMPPCAYHIEFDHGHAAALTSWMLSNDAVDNYKAYLWLNVRRGYHSRADRQVTDTIDRVLIMHHHGEVLTRREASAGKAAKDRYAWAIPAQSQTA